MAALAALLAAGCQSRDVGEQCDALKSTTQPAACTEATDTADYFESSAANGCDNLICIHSPGSVGDNGQRCYQTTESGTNFYHLSGLCSKPCVSDSDCFPDETRMVCRRMLLSEAFITWLQQNDPQALQRYLQDIQFSSYCALPLTSG